MDFQTLSSLNSLDKLKCSNCKNFLSYFPISVGFSSQNQNYCGRCTSAEDAAVQNVAFETLSQFLNFPCRYASEGCTEELLPKKMPEHEKLCPFRIIPCPTNPWKECNWEGKRIDIMEHCREQHNEMFLTNGECGTDWGPSDSHSFIEHENILLIFTRRFDSGSQILYFSVYTSQFELDPTKYDSQLNIKCGNKSLSVDFITARFDDMNFTEVSLESIKSSEAATLTVTIGAPIQDPDRIINPEMLSILKCFVCHDYAVPPIHHCIQNSETLCWECKTEHMSACNPCLRTTTCTRNINLDKMAGLLNYPCKYKANGCFFISKPEKIRQHEAFCDLGIFECPINEFEVCGWKGLRADVEEHIQNNHQELVSNATQLSKQLLPQRMKCDIIKFSNQLFRLVCMRSPEDKYMWTVQVMGPCREDFKFEIEIVDPNNHGRRLLVRQQCPRLTKKDQLFRTSGDYCYFTKDQIRHFIVDQTVTFRVHIFI